MKTQLICFLILMASLANASAATITLDAPSGTVDIGSDFTIGLVGIDFAVADATHGGGVDLHFNPSVLQLKDVSFAGSAFGFNTYVGNFNEAAGKVESISVAEFFNPPSGNFSIAMVEFTAIGAGVSALDVLPSTLEAPWLRLSNGTDIDPLLSGGSVTVAAAPLPAPAWLLISGLAMLGCRGGLSRCRSSTGH